MTNKLMIVVFALTIYSQSVWAQGDTLSLLQAITIGLNNNYDIQMERLTAQNTKENNVWGEAGLWPNITLNATQNNNILQRTPATPFAVPGLNYSNSLSARINVQFLLFNGFKAHINKKRLEQLTQQSDGNTMFVIENTIQTIMIAYYQTLMEKERLHVFEENVALSRVRYTHTQLKKELGSAITFDVLQAKSSYLTDSTNALQQKLIYQQSLRQLKLILNINNNTSYNLTDSLWHQPRTYDYDKIYEKMMASNIALRNQYTYQELLKQNTALRKAERLPSLSLDLGLNGSLDVLNAQFRLQTGNTVEQQLGLVNRDISLPVYANVNETATMRNTQIGNTFGGYANINLRYTIFNGGKIKRALQQARIQEKIAALNTEKLKTKGANDLRAAYDNYQLRIKLSNIATIKQKTAQINMELADIKYRNGALSGIELRIVQENARNATLDYYQTIFLSLSSHINMMRIAGMLIEQIDSSSP